MKPRRDVFEIRNHRFSPLLGVQASSSLVCGLPLFFARSPRRCPAVIIRLLSLVSCCYRVSDRDADASKIQEVLQSSNPVKDKLKSVTVYSIACAYASPQAFNTRDK
ncbi:hypothetical protein L2E82_31204 [Cichorium intybus]|uniref:Uncharacterized protein n=1 Tax=Cichorium intybus TaxID=13427 RepID=A0ACB9D2D5_CICIN|nr:hypothetical protein L2E82_31204 [Cichorium intybus]